MGVGLLSGLVSALTFSLDGSWYGPYTPGLAFGVKMGLLLVLIRLAESGRALLFAVFSVVSWYIALQFAIFFVEFIDPVISGETARMVVTGVAAGALGAVLLGAGAAWLFPWARVRSRLVLTVALCGLSGTALALDWGDGMPLFIAWQGCFALCLALGFPLSPHGAKD